MSSHFSQLDDPKFKIPSVDSPSVLNQEAKEVNESLLASKIVESAKDKLPNSPYAAETSDSGWVAGIWSWLGYGKSEEAKPTGDDEFKDEGKSPTDEGDIGGLGWGDQESVETEEADEDSVFKLAAAKAYEAYEAAKKGVAEGARKSVAYGVTASVGTIASSYKKFNEGSVVDAQKEIMLKELQDPQYVEFYEAIESALLPYIQEDILDSMAKESDITSQVITSQQDLIVKLLKVVLARGFANLATQVKAHHDLILNFDHQPSLVSVISFLCQKGERHVDQGRIEGIERKYHKDELDLVAHIQRLFPGIDDRPEEKAVLVINIQEYIKSTDSKRKEAIENELFPDFKAGLYSAQAKREIQTLFCTLDNLHGKHQELNQLFSLLSEDILLSLFPNKLSDIKEVQGLLTNFRIPMMMEKNLGDMIFDGITGAVAKTLQESYVPLENNKVRGQEWERDLKTRLGVPDLRLFVEAPSALLVAFAKNYIQSDPAVLETAEGIIDSLFNAPVLGPVKKRLERIRGELAKLGRELYAEDKTLIDALEVEVNKLGQKKISYRLLRSKKKELEKAQSLAVRNELGNLNRELDDLIRVLKDQEKKRKNILNQLSHQQLANWLVVAVQTMLNGEDPHILGLANFGKQAMNNLTLALIAKGTKLVMPEGLEVQPDAFIKEFSERLIEKAGAVQGAAAVSEKFWIDFVNDLPLPPLVRGMLVPILIEKAKSLQTDAKRMNREFEEVQRVHREAFKKADSYAEGGQLISITEQVSEQIVKQILEKNIELVSTLGFGDTIEELMANYLPGVTINEDLKKWFKQNISSLGVAEGEDTSCAITMLKDGIQAVLLKSMVNTIEKNFSDNSGDYAAQLLGNIHEVFSKAFHGFNEDQRTQLDEAIKIQREIDAKNKQIQELKDSIPKKPEGIDLIQYTLLDDVIAANIRHVRGAEFVEKLIEKRNDHLADLNESLGNRYQISSEDLLSVNQLLARQKVESATFSSEDEYAKHISETLSALRKSVRDGGYSTDLNNEIKELQLLLTLIKMSSAQLKMLTDALNTQSTLKHAENELEHLSQELQASKGAIIHYEKKPIKNQRVWDEAKQWMDGVLEGKKTLKRLSLEMEKLEERLDAQLNVFQVFSKELTGLLGWEKKESLDLPPFLQSRVWPLIESAQNKQFARFLFTQITPFFTCMEDANKNRERLKELSVGNPFLGQFIQAVSEDVISRIPYYVTSYKPIARQILTDVGVENPTEADVARMESSFSHRLIQLGKDGTKASMLKPLLEGVVPKDEEEALSQSIALLIVDWDDAEIPYHGVLDLLRNGREIGDKAEELQLEKQAKILTKNINQFLFNRGKTSLTVQDLLESYNHQAVGKQQKLSFDQMIETADHLIEGKFVEKIQTIVISPEEIAAALNDVIPGATDLHSLIAPQLQAVIVGQDAPFKFNREILQKFLEAMILKLFVKIAKANEEVGSDENAMAVITRKLKDLAENTVPNAGQNLEETARQMIDEVLTGALSLDKKEDLGMFPESLQQLIHTKLKEQAYQQLTPLLLPIIERNQSRVLLANISGSGFMGSLCKALSKDVFTLAPFVLDSYYIISEQLLNELSNHQELTPAQVKEFTSEIFELVKHNNVKDHLIVEAYAKVMGKELTQKEKGELRTKLEQQNAKNKIKNILVTPEQITALIGEFVPHLDGRLQKSMAVEMQKFIQEGSHSYLNTSEFIGAYIEGVLLKVFIGIAEKNPKYVSQFPSVSSKDSMVVLTENLLRIAKQKYQEARDSGDYSRIAKELNDAIMNDVLGIDSSSAFKGLPESLQAIAYDELKDQIGGFVSRIQDSLGTIQKGNKRVEETKEDVKKFGVAETANKATLHILVEDLAKMAIDSAPYVLAEQMGENLKGVVIISKGMENYFEDLSRGNIAMANVLLGFTRGEQFKSILKDNLTDVADQSNLINDRKQAVDLVESLLLAPLGQVIEKAINFEAKHKKEFNQKLMVKLLHIGAEHLRHLSDAKDIAGGKENQHVQYRDFLEVAETELHRAVPTDRVTYEETIEAIEQKIYKTLNPKQADAWKAVQDRVCTLIGMNTKKELDGAQVIDLDRFVKEFELIHLEVMGNPLTQVQQDALKSVDKDGFTLRDIMRREADAPTRQRVEEAYGPTTQVVLKMLFPKGKEDLTFIPEELRETVWNQFKTNLFPLLLPMLTELLLEPAMINTMILNSLQSMNESLSEKIDPNAPSEPESLRLDELDEVSGELITQALRATALPAWAKKLAIDPKTGEVRDSIRKSLGSTLRAQFNDVFIKEKLKIALESAIKRDEVTGKANLSFDSRPREVKAAEAVKNAAKMEQDLKKTFRETINVGISFAIRNYWVAFQSKFDKLIEAKCGKAGTQVKEALDLMCRFVFFTLVGTVLDWLTYPLRLALQEVLYEWILHLDESRKKIFGLLTDVPNDQPEAGIKQHAVYNEDLVFQAGQALAEVVKEFLEKERIVPIQAESPS